jgi:hypothetical protein
MGKHINTPDISLQFEGATENLKERIISAIGSSVIPGRR